MSETGTEYREEADLVERARDGDLLAFDALVSRYRAPAVAVAMSLVGRESAEDVAQDALLAAFKALPQLQEVERFSAWFGAIVRHRARRVSAGAKMVHVPLDDLIVSHAPSMTAAWQRSIESEAVRAAIAELPAEFRTIVDLYYLEEWRVAQIAEFVALPVTTVKWRLHTARGLLNRSLSECLEE